MLALVLDVVYQIIAEHFVYPGEAITVAIVLALVPYLIRFLPLARQIAPKVSNPKHTTSLGETILICGNANSSAARQWRKGISADDYQILEVRTAIFVLDQGPIYKPSGSLIREAYSYTVRPPAGG